MNLIINEKVNQSKLLNLYIVKSLIIQKKTQKKSRNHADLHKLSRPLML
jgi:hypothetical protein